jgi:hypothetical protein
MTAQVAVIVDSRTNVLELPTSAITTTGLASTVTVVSNGKQTTEVVVLGLKGDSTTQIMSGVTAGQVVVQPTATVASSAASTTGSTAARTGAVTGAGGFGAGAGATGAAGGGFRGP